ncbi:MAG: pyridoxal-dependent decarboxylase [Planctomycetota bacterium]
MNDPKYRGILDQVRQAFPAPTSDRVHDAYFVFSILRALDQVDDLKSVVPMLGETREIDYERAATARVEEGSSSVEDVTRDLVQRLVGLPNWGHPHNQVNVVAPPSIASIIGSLLPSIYNPNLVSEESSMGVLEAEAEVAAMSAGLVGYNPETSAGVFTGGGTLTNFYGVRIGLDKAIPGALESGLNGECVVIACKQSHYARLNVAGWAGIGQRNVVEVPSGLESDIRIDLFEEAMRRVLDEGRRIGCIVATMGTTDAFGIDDLEAMVEIRDRLTAEYELDYRPHIHADAVIGWAWSVFSDYEFETNPLGFRPRTVRALAKACRRISKLHLADSLGIDFHKTGFCPYISSIFLVKDREDMNRIVRKRETMPYLFQSGTHHPGLFTLETSRPGGGVLAALASLKLFGREGLRALLGHLVEMAEVLREKLEGHASISVLNGDNVGMVTLFRVYPDGVDTWSIKSREREDESFSEQLVEHNAYNRKIFEVLHEKAMKGEGIMISMTDSYRTSEAGVPIAALKSYCLSPFVDEKPMQLLVDAVLEARRVVAEG